MIRILLVDDQELVRSGFRIILDTEPGFEVVGEAHNGEEAVELAQELQPDVICMDVEMPIMNGIESTRKILAAPGEAPAILILTTFGHEEYLFEALAAGVSGFLLKTAKAEQLINAVHTLASGQALLGSDVTKQVIARIQSSNSEPVSDAHTETNTAVINAAGLTERELDVLVLVAEGKSNSEIALALFLGESTIKTHVSNLLRKLEARDRIQAVVWAHTHGLRA